MKGTNAQNITVKIDGKTVSIRKGKTILDAAQKAGIYIPTLCHLENLEPYGGCRLCMVEIKNTRGYPTACTTPVIPGMEIKTKTPELQSLRKEILELTLSEHPYTCLTCRDKKECTDFMHTTRKAGTITGCNFCPNNGDCELQNLVDYLELSDIRYPITYRGIPPEKRNPFYDLDYNLCILCGRCVRICNEERNSKVLAFIKRGQSTIVGTAFNESQADAGCEFCGACVDVCPTGSISGKIGKWAGLPDHSTETTCTLCSVGCTMNVNSRGNRVVNVGPKPGRRTDPPQLCIRGKFLAGDITNHPSRITTPMIRRNGKWIEVKWDEALGFTAAKLEKHRGNGFGMICSAQDTLEENYSLQKFSRKVMHSNNIDLYGSWPDRNLIKDLHRGSMDLLKTDTILVLGTDASVSHPLVENKIRKAYNMGNTILYANAYHTRTSQFSTSEIYYSNGKDYLFLYLLLAGLAKENIPGLPAGLAKQLKEPIGEKALKACSVKKEDLDAFVKSLARSRSLCIIAGDGLLRSDSGRETMKALDNIQYLKGEKSRCNILILGPEGNFYGGVLSGAHPDSLPGFDPVSDGKAIKKWNKIWDAKLNTSRGLTYHEMLENMGKDGISALLVAGDIPMNPGIKKLKFLVQLNMFRTDLSEFADVFMPVTGLLENEGHFLTLEGKIKKLRRAVPGAGSSKTLPAIVSGLASAMNESGFSDFKAGAVWKEMQSHVQMKTPDPGDYSQVFRPLKPGIPEKGLRLKTPYNYFRYRGNSLVDLVPDLKILVEQGFLGSMPKVKQVNKRAERT